MPALADVGEASDLDSLAPVLTGGVAIFLAVIGYFAFQFAATVAEQAPERAERMGFNKKGPGRGRRNEAIYDDTDFSYAKNRVAVENSRTRKKVSKQFGKDGKRLAPWQIIDEQRVDKVRQQRRENKKRTGKFFG